MASNLRQTRLKTIFKAIVFGERPVNSSHDAQLFLEAIRCQEPPSACVEMIVSHPAGLDAVRNSVRSNLSESFILSHTLPFLEFLSDPGIKSLADGELLAQLLVVIANPPTLWKALVKLFNGHQLPPDRVHPFAWLALELLSLPQNAGVDVLEEVQAIVEDKSLLKAQDHSARELGYRIEKVLQLRSSSKPSVQANGPGGRHDNDSDVFRKIAIYPTTDEFLSNQQPFYRTAFEVAESPLDRRPAIHLDNQFRLLREDMLAELREDLQVAMDAKKAKKPLLTIGKLQPVALSLTDANPSGKGPRYKPCTLMVRCYHGLEFLNKMEPEKLKKFLKDNPTFLKHQSFGVLTRGKEVIAFAFVDRDRSNELLLQSPPIVCLQFADPSNFKRALLALKLPNAQDFVRFTLVNTPVFAYEPVLAGLQAITELPLQDLLINPSGASLAFAGVPKLQTFVSALKSARSGMILGNVEAVRIEESITVDLAQLDSILHALTKPITLIQGPPGTGKSFIGAQIAKHLHKAGQRILVLSYTNHALDQFLEDLLDVGIPQQDVVRMGAKAKSTLRTLPLVLSEQKGGYRRTRDAWTMIDLLRQKAASSAQELQTAFGTYGKVNAGWAEVSEFLEFLDDPHPFYEALLVPTNNSGWMRTGKKGKRVGPDYLFQRWVKGEDPGVFKTQIPETSHSAWRMSLPERQSHLDRWTKELIEERLATIEELARQYNETQSRIDAQFNDADTHTMRQKRVIGCTTTGAAKHTSLIRAAAPDVILVEEAGEILESHVLTALAPSVKQLILIGDHKQLRPKINNYALSVDQGDGFDLNRSLFERLIMQGAPHTTLQKQHRMVPEISMIPRVLTYPDLLDGPKTSGRPRIRGLQDHVVFINHGKLEDTDKALKERRDPGAKESKKNTFEAQMVLECIKFFGQQGYPADKLVILTPYLGQLRVLQDLLRENQHDPALSEMDKLELLRAGLLSKAAAKVDQKPLRVSTIDNYQGEENDIVIASLTRSNKSGDIGFMSAPERLNVLVTRARNCLVMIGNMGTFMSSKKGGPTWRPFFELMESRKHLYDGLPVRCEKHPDKTALLKEPIDFLMFCPDGGCTEPCDALLKCGKHKCKSRCHRVVDHSQAPCHEMIAQTCERNHKLKVSCDRQNDNCRECVREDKEQERRMKRDLQLEEDRLLREEAHRRSLQEVDDEIDHLRRVNQYLSDQQSREQTLEQRRQELAALKDAQVRVQEQAKQQAEISRRVAEKAKRRAEQETNAGQNADPQDPLGDLPDTAEGEWNYLKKFERASSKPMDTLMSMIGLEEVKQKFLDIKSKVDTAVRQGISLSKERYSCSMLGNPGTGKTTVARLYAKFLCEVGVIPGHCFKETTGAGLANIGINGCKKLIEEILNEGGGVLFIDEAYQLTSGNNPGGGSVLDYLLAEIENLRGKVVFVLAGYNKQMESFYAHNPGLPSRFPVEMKFEDYTDDELLRIFKLKVNEKYKDAMYCEDGLHGLYCRIISRRIGYGRGKEGFGNARTVENTLDIISTRQANRIRRERKAKKPDIDDLFFTKEDLIGPEPTEALQKCQAWKKLQQLIGLSSVKESVKSLVDSIQANYRRELAEQPLIQYSLNKVFLGNPGTGKTTVAKLYGEILVALGMLSKGEVVVKNPSDFVGAVLGQSEQQTKGILAASLGKVLVIDEAYGLYGGGGTPGSTSDPYKTAVIDTIVAEVQSVPGDDRCVLLLGYKDQMETMFHNVNPGLARRFPIASGFNFEDFSDDELQKIFDLKINQQGYQATAGAAVVAMEMLKRARNRPNFGNAGEVDILLNDAKARHQQRLAKGKAQSETLFEPQDFDGDFDRATKSGTNVRKLFEGSVGSEEVIALLEGYQETVRTFKSIGMDPKENIPFNFLFRGPPATGKTTTAKKMGQVFYDMGFLSTAEVEECSASEMIGKYVGHTGPLVRAQLDKALGRVLFIDEAYRLADGHFAKEAIDELVDSCTKERYNKKLIIILAGYEADINRLMSVNSGLTSRFPEVINFRALSPEECVELLRKRLEENHNTLKEKSIELDILGLRTPSSGFKKLLVSYFKQLSAQDNWASARDVQSLAKNMFNQVMRDQEGLSKGRIVLTEDIIRQELEAMVLERASRGKAAAEAATPNGFPSGMPQFFQAPPQQQQASFNTSTAKVTSFAQEQARVVEEVFSEEEEEEDDDDESAPPPVELKEQAVDTSDSRYAAKRDAGVSDTVWEQLQRDRQSEQEKEEEYRKLKEAAKKAKDAARDKIVKKLLEEERKRKVVEEMKKKLQMMGICPAGFAWIRQDRGYRCAGGAHFVGDEAFGKL
ncbi:P-loop containing nucleoside triphosphate hydrolase protein [Neurospora tetraspora]|uniref:P-loop containing nucleoside triphosphate hydrolase protein n=1 Tax=Neurospora tetraspora TaxID=94610 RepID=A0AAE0JGS9_9PEZI|nr:P-loop containing nucleoside triphosphate hydrolase protein [Neurospora tetraspora]